MSYYRRHYPRAANPSVVLELPGDQGPVHAPVRDLSAGGVRVSVASTVPVGAELDVRLTEVGGGDDEVLNLRARVLRIQLGGGETDLALEFVDRVERASSRLQSWVEGLRRGGTGEPPPGAETVELPRISAPSPPSALPPVAAPAPLAAPAPVGSARDERERSHLEAQLSAQVERADRAEAALQALRADLVEEQERRLAAERTLVTLQSELSRARSERGELERLRREVEELRVDPGPAPALERDLGALGRDDAAASRAGPQRPARSAESGAEVSVEEGVAAGGGVLLGPEDIRSRVVFARHLREGAKLRRTDRFARFEPVSRLDVRVHDYARRASELAQIRKLAARRVSEEEILRVLYTFFERGLLRLEPAGPSEVLPSASGSGATR